MHVARLKFPAPGTEETWVTDGAGDPLLVVMAQPSSSLASQIRGLLPQPRGIAGQDRKVTLCFDRGGWSPDLFADIIDAGFHLLTYRKNDTGKDAPALPGRCGWRLDQADHPRHPDGRLQRRDHLGPALHGHYARAGDEACALIREALTTSGDITPRDRTLHVRLDPLTAPRRTRALAVLCAQLNDTQTRYPGTTLTLRYEVKEHPGTA